MFYPNPVLVQANYLSDWPVELLHLLQLAKTSNTFDIKHLSYQSEPWVHYVGI